MDDLDDLISLDDLNTLDAGAAAGPDESSESDSSENEAGDQMEGLEELKPMDANAVAKLLSSSRLRDHLRAIDDASVSSTGPTTRGPLEEDPQYKLIVDSNILMVDIDNEILSVHKFIRDLYSKKFPELEQLVPNPIDYIRTVRVVGNETDLTNNAELPKILPNATVMVVVVSATTTSGQQLAPEELQRVNDACELALRLEEARAKLLRFIESRMHLIAPNLSVVLGTTIAAKLIGAAGGLANLARTPACNIQVMGAKKRSLAGFSTRAVQPHMGYVLQSDLLQNTPPPLRMRAMRLVAGKCALLARIDWSRQHPEGTTGREFREMIENKIEKWQEPPPGKKLKALPAPIEKAKKKRGGRKARKLKEKLGMTDVRKQMNRVAFGGVEEQMGSFGDAGKGFGMLGQSGSGKVRVAAKDTKVLAKAHKLLNKDSAGTKTARTVSGLTTSLAFTPVQGLELENPLAAQQRAQAAAEKEKYFSSTAGFMFAVPKRIKRDDGGAGAAPQ